MFIVAYEATAAAAGNDFLTALVRRLRHARRRILLREALGRIANRL
jgi:hypothetical protein